MSNGYGPCCVGITSEHIISKQMLRNNKRAKSLVEKEYPHIFLAEVCLFHNSATKCADTKGARLYLLRKRWEEYGQEFELALTELRAAYKAPPEYLSLERLA
jgi:hypothetical protein